MSIINKKLKKYRELKENHFKDLKNFTNNIPQNIIEQYKKKGVNIVQLRHEAILKLLDYNHPEWDDIDKISSAYVIIDEYLDNFLLELLYKQENIDMLLSTITNWTPLMEFEMWLLNNGYKLVQWAGLKATSLNKKTTHENERVYEDVTGIFKLCIGMGISPKFYCKILVNNKDIHNMNEHRTHDSVYCVPTDKDNDRYMKYQELITNSAILCFLNQTHESQR